MAIIFSENFNAGLDPGWSNIVGIPVPFGGAGFGTGMGFVAGDKRFIACTGTAQTRHLFTDTPTISIRAMMAWIAPDSVGQWEAIYAHGNFTPTNGPVMILQLRGDGRISIRCNHTSSATLSPSTTGLFPTDGTPFALQWRMTINSSESISVAVTINNVEVWTHTYTSTDNVLGTDLWTFHSVFNEISLITASNVAFDNLEVDNSTTDISYPVDSNFPKLKTPMLNPIVTNLAVTVGSPNFVITGSNFRRIVGSTSSPLVYLKDPNEVVYYSIDPSAMSSIVVTDTTISGILSFNIWEGNWCVQVGNTGLCWEIQLPLVYTCFDVGDVTEPPSPSGLYFINPAKATRHDSYYGGIEKKIPNPTIKTALIGE